MIPIDYLSDLFHTMQEHGVTHLETSELKVHLPGAGQSQAQQQKQAEPPQPLDLEPVRINAAGEIEVNPALFGG